MATIFVSRTLKPGGALATWAKANGHRLVARSFLRFDPVPFVLPDDADWWFFYSSRCVAFGLKGKNKLPPGTRIAAMGPGTAAALELRGLIPDFVGNGQPGAVATQFMAVAEGAKVFFPRARQSRKTIQKMIAGKVEVRDAVCYDNVAEPATEEVTADVYVFTSPLNVAAYLGVFPVRRNRKYVGMGPSTATALQTFDIVAEYPAQPTEAALAEKLAELLSV